MNSKADDQFELLMAQLRYELGENALRLPAGQLKLILEHETALVPNFVSLLCRRVERLTHHIVRHVTIEQGESLSSIKADLKAKFDQLWGRDSRVEFLLEESSIRSMPQPVTAEADVWFFRGGEPGWISNEELAVKYKVRNLSPVNARQLFQVVRDDISFRHCYTHWQDDQSKWHCAYIGAKSSGVLTAHPVLGIVASPLHGYPRGALFGGVPLKALT